MSLEVFVTSRNFQVEKLFLGPGEHTPIIGQNCDGSEIRLLDIIPKKFGGDILFNGELIHLPRLRSGSTKMQTEFVFEVGSQRFDIIAPFPDCQ